MTTPLTKGSLGQYLIMLCTCQHPLHYCAVHVKRT